MIDINGDSHSIKNGQYIKQGEQTDKELLKMSIEDLKKCVLKVKNNQALQIISPEEKVKNVHIESGKDNILPELNEKDLAEIGVQQNKKVLVKASVIVRNAVRHPEVVEFADKIIGETLYNSSAIFKGNKEKPYFTFVKPMRVSNKDLKNEISGLVLLDVNDEKENFEVVHWHWIGERELEKIKNNLK